MSWPFPLIIITLLRYTKIDLYCTIFQTHIGFSVKHVYSAVFTLSTKRLVGTLASPPLPVSLVCSDWSAEHQSYNGVGTAVYFIYIYIFNCCYRRVWRPRAFVLRWGGAEEANQRDHGHLRSRGAIKPSCPESHGGPCLSPKRLQED